MNLFGLMGCDDACQRRRKADELKKNGMRQKMLKRELLKILKMQKETTMFILRAKLVGKTD
jgi:hypothetical protein